MEQTWPTRSLSVSLSPKHTKYSIKAAISKATCSGYCQCCLSHIVLASVCKPSCSARIPNDILNCPGYCFSSSMRTRSSPSARPQRMQRTKTSGVLRQNLTAHSYSAVSVGSKHFCSLVFDVTCAWSDFLAFIQGHRAKNINKYIFRSVLFWQRKPHVPETLTDRFCFSFQSDVSAIEQLGCNGRFDKFLIHKYAPESLDPDRSMAATLPDYYYFLTFTLKILSVEPLIVINELKVRKLKSVSNLLFVFPVPN